MALSIAHLGPSGTNAETAATQYADWLARESGQETILRPYFSIAQTFQAVAQKQVDLAVVPVENSTEGSVTVTLDSLWRLDSLRIQQAIVLPIINALISQAESFDQIQKVYSHPQAIAQCQGWLGKNLPQAQLIPINSTTEALQHLDGNPDIAAIAAPRAAQIYHQPILVSSINDYPDNCTRFWVLSLQPSPGGRYTSLAFTIHDTPGALVKPLQVFANRSINMNKIESRPTKRSLGDYLFFIDLEADTHDPSIQAAIEELADNTETLKVFGSYEILPASVVSNED